MLQAPIIFECAELLLQLTSIKQRPSRLHSMICLGPTETSGSVRSLILLLMLAPCSTSLSTPCHGQMSMRFLVVLLILVMLCLMRVTALVMHQF